MERIKLLTMQLWKQQAASKEEFFSLTKNTVLPRMRGRTALYQLTSNEDRTGGTHAFLSNDLQASHQL